VVLASPVNKLVVVLFKAVKQIAKKEKVKRMLTHVISGANISLTDRFLNSLFTHLAIF
jgi:hypothetical protein